jgi:hypothetical protein
VLQLEPLTNLYAPEHGETKDLSLWVLTAMGVLDTNAVSTAAVGDER